MHLIFIQISYSLRVSDEQLLVLTLHSVYQLLLSVCVCLICAYYRSILSKMCPFSCKVDLKIK